VGNERELKYFTEDMQLKLFNQLRKEAEDDKEKLKYLNLYTVDFGTGIRLGELLGLKWQDFNEEDHTLTICRTIKRVSIIDENGKGSSFLKEMEPKAKTSNRIIPLCDKVYDALLSQKEIIDINKRLLNPLDLYTDLDLIFPTKTGNYIDSRDLT